MLSLITPLIITFARLVSTPAAPAATGHAAVEARLESTALGAKARSLAAGVLTDADAIADFVVVEGAVTFEVELAGELHELRVELDPRGGVVGASVWWLGEAEGLHSYDLAEVLPALEEAGTLDAILVEDGVMSITAGSVVVPVSAEYEHDLEEEEWEGEEEDEEGEKEPSC